MTLMIKEGHPALKHGGYSATRILPGEDAAEFAKLHQALIAEWAPNGALEDDIIETMAHALWRKRNFQTFRIAKRARERMIQIHEAMVEDPSSDRSIEFEKVFSEKCRAAEDQARKELGEQYGLVELAEEATIDHLMKELDAQARLDAVIDRCIRRLLLVRGLKSISTGSTSTSLASLPNTSRTQLRQGSRGSSEQTLVGAGQ